MGSKTGMSEVYSIPVQPGINSRVIDRYEKTWTRASDAYWFDVNVATMSWDELLVHRGPLTRVQDRYNIVQTIIGANKSNDGGSIKHEGLTENDATAKLEEMFYDMIERALSFKTGHQAVQYQKGINWRLVMNDNSVMEMEMRRA